MTDKPTHDDQATKSGPELDVETALADLSAAMLNRGPGVLLDHTRRALDAARTLIVQLKAAPGAAPADALACYDDAQLLLGDAAALASVCRHAHPAPAMREAAEQAERDIDALATELSLDRGVFDALAAAAAHGEALDPAGRHLLKKTLAAMRRSGVDRDEATRAQVRALREELLQIAQEFDRNIVADVRAAELAPDDLDGLPADYVANHPAKDGVVRVTTDSTDFVPFMTYARRAPARERLWLEHRRRAQATNLPVLDRLLRRRWDLAHLLGYPSYAACETEDKMIGTVEHAAAFIEETAQAAKPRADRDYAALLERKRKDDPGAARVDSWDAGYLSDRVSEERFGFSAQSARPYLEYGRVKAGVLDTVGRVFGVRFHAVPEAQAARVRWHDQVEVYDVVDAADPPRALGRIYLDMHPREGKYKHFAQFTLRSGVDRPGRHRLPEGALICNFPDPARGLALLELDQLRTFLHEFGHLMHHVLGGHVRWACVSGVTTEWDFVEAPSQLFEEWAWDHDTLARFATHHETGAPIPRALLDKARAADRFGKGLWVRQQMLYAALSLEYHRRDPASFDTTQLLAELQARYTPYAFVPGTAFQASFDHLAGYSAVYYTYMWSLVIAKDLFSRFLAEGMLAERPTRDYRREVLEPGGGKPAAELVSAFLGRPYAVEAFRAWLDGT